MSYPPYQQNMGAPGYPNQQLQQQNAGAPYPQSQHQQQYPAAYPSPSGQQFGFSGPPQQPGYYHVSQQQPMPAFNPYSAPGTNVPPGQVPYQQQSYTGFSQQPQYGAGPRVDTMQYANAPYPGSNQPQPNLYGQQPYPSPNVPSQSQQPGLCGAGFAGSSYPSTTPTYPTSVGTGAGFSSQGPLSYPYHSNQPSNLGQSYPPTMSRYQGTVRPAPSFSANDDAEALRKAMKGIGCNDRDVMNVLCYRSNEQRQQIRQAFKTMFGKDLMRELISELKGNFEDLIVALIYTPAEYDARELDYAMRGMGTTESTLIEIMTTRTNEEIQAIKYAYKTIYHKELEQALVSETSGHFRRLLVSLSVGGRDESDQVDRQRAAAQAKQLYDAGEKCWGTDESAFNGVMVMNNAEQLKAVFDEYRNLTGHDVEQAISGEFSGDVKDGLMTLVKIARNRPAYFAERAYLSMKGLGTDDRALIRVIVSRCEKDMVQVKQEYQRLYKATLEQDITGDTSGKYKEGLLALIKG